MRSSMVAILLASLFAHAAVEAAQSEWEPNNNPEQANASQFNNLAINDQIVAQLYAQDQDLFYVDVYPGSQPANIPVYFGCNLSLPRPRILFTDPDTGTATFVEVSVNWQISYYYSASGFGNDLVLQSSYQVSSDFCKQNAAEIKGPFRFQMNTVYPGRYYVSVTGDSDVALTGKPVGPLSDYTLWAVTKVVKGMPEPNDGKTEATVLRRNQRMGGQLASMYDQDWYTFKVGNGSPGKAELRFRCQSAEDSANFGLSWYDPNLVQQASYQVPASACKAQSFNFTMRTRVVGHYYAVVTPPAGPSGTGEFSNSNYSVRVGNSQASGGGTSGPCPAGQALVRVPLPVTTENCGRRPLSFCTPYQWQCQ